MGWSKIWCLHYGQSYCVVCNNKIFREPFSLFYDSQLTDLLSCMLGRQNCGQKNNGPMGSLCWGRAVLPQRLPRGGTKLLRRERWLPGSASAAL